MTVEFFSTVSFWDVPSDPTVQGAAGTAGSAQPPYYLLAGLPNPVREGTDYLPEVVARARTRHPDLRFEVADITAPRDLPARG